MPHHLLNQAQDHHRAGNFTEAKKYYDLYLAQHPSDVEALHAFAILFAQHNHFPQALDTLKKAINIDSTNPAFYNSLGNIYRHQLKLSEAIIAFKKAVELNSEYAIAYNNLGNVYYQQEELQAAKLSYEKAIALQPNYVDAHHNLGIVFTQLNEDELAILHLQKVLALKPESLSALNQLGDLYLRQEKYVQAQTIFIQCLTLSPDNINAHYQCGICLFKQKEFEHASQHFETVIMSDHRYLEVNQYLANTWLELGEHDKASHYYFRQLEKEPLFETYYNLGVLFMMKEKLNDALSYFNEALKINMNDLAIHQNCGHIYLKQKKLSQAIMHYEKALSLKTNDAEIQHILAALKKNEIPSKAPNAYVTHLFDQYAPYYETHLTKHLDYHSPEKLLKAITVDCGVLEDNAWNIVDLGCGTGLCGPLFKPYAKQLIGVDLSDSMLAIARTKNCYDECIQSDITDALTKMHDVNLVLAADVFTYVGDLDAIFKHVKNALMNGGLFAFTVEKTFDDSFVLQTTIRYAHNKKYIETLAEKYDFEIIRIDNTELRKQKNESIEGYLVVLKCGGHVV